MKTRIQAAVGSRRRAARNLALLTAVGIASSGVSAAFAYNMSGSTRDSGYIETKDVHHATHQTGWISSGNLTTCQLFQKTGTYNHTDLGFTCSLAGDSSLWTWGRVYNKSGSGVLVATYGQNDHTD